MGFGFFAGPWGAGGGFGWRGARRFKRGLLKWIVLKLIAEDERHGYDILRVFEQRGWGGRRAGSIYPILSSLEEAGLVATREENGKRVYVITEKGRRHLEEEGPDFDLDDLEAEEHPSSPMQEAVRRFSAAAAQAASTAKPETVEQIIALLDKTRKEIYTLLANE